MEEHGGKSAARPVIGCLTAEKIAAAAALVPILLGLGFRV